MCLTYSDIHRYVSPPPYSQNYESPQQSSQPNVRSKASPPPSFSSFEKVKEKQYRRQKQEEYREYLNQQLREKEIQKSKEKSEQRQIAQIPLQSHESVNANNYQQYPPSQSHFSPPMSNPSINHQYAARDINNNQKNRNIGILPNSEASDDDNRFKKLQYRANLDAQRAEDQRIKQQILSQEKAKQDALERKFQAQVELEENEKKLELERKRVEARQQLKKDAELQEEMRNQALMRRGKPNVSQHETPYNVQSKHVKYADDDIILQDPKPIIPSSASAGSNQDDYEYELYKQYLANKNYQLPEHAHGQTDHSYEVDYNREAEHYKENPNQFQSSPSKSSPNKARERLISDVYGSVGILPGGGPSHTGNTYCAYIQYIYLVHVNSF